ncbi:MAG: hypothetical protein MHMPM18_003727, partial [Marteilia pararefringens]
SIIECSKFIKDDICTKYLSCLDRKIPAKLTHSSSSSYYKQFGLDIVPWQRMTRFIKRHLVVGVCSKELQFENTPVICGHDVEDEAAVRDK